MGVTIMNLGVDVYTKKLCMHLCAIKYKNMLNIYSKFASKSLDLN